MSLAQQEPVPFPPFRMFWVVSHFMEIQRSHNICRGVGTPDVAGHSHANADDHVPSQLLRLVL